MEAPFNVAAEEAKKDGDAGSSTTYQANRPDWSATTRESSNLSCPKLCQFVRLEGFSIGALEDAGASSCRPGMSSQLPVSPVFFPVNIDSTATDAPTTHAKH